MMHVDFMVEDRDAAEARVLAAGATKYDFQPNSKQCFVYADPAGHPFLPDHLGSPHGLTKSLPHWLAVLGTEINRGKCWWSPGDSNP